MSTTRSACDIADQNFFNSRIFHSGALRARARKRAAPDGRMESRAGLGSF